jgi:hypothetical protein
VREQLLLGLSQERKKAFQEILATFNAQKLLILLESLGMGPGFVKLLQNHPAKLLASIDNLAGLKKSLPDCLALSLLW